MTEENKSIRRMRNHINFFARDTMMKDLEEIHGRDNDLSFSQTVREILNLGILVHKQKMEREKGLEKEIESRME